MATLAGERASKTGTLITPQTDLKPFIGKRVKVERTMPDGRGIHLGGTVRWSYYGVFTSLWHSHEMKNPVTPTPHCGGMLLEEPHGDCRGGHTGFDLPYHNATVELAPAL